jgi:OPT family oligopeptide transporter
MALFQKAPKDPSEAAKYPPLDIAPDKVQEMDEKTWYAQVFRGEHVPQLTVRAVLVGSVLGLLLAFTNLYVGLMTGWGLGVAITASILAFSLWNTLLAARIAKSPLTILETNCMQSTASAAGYATGSTMVSAIPAMLMLSATTDNPKGELPVVGVFLWTLLLGALGTLMAIPMKRNLINRERLKFPTGTAAAATLQALYSQGGEARKKASALLYSMGIGAIFPILIDLKLKTVAVAGKVGEFTREALLPADSKLFDWIPFGSSRKGEPLHASDWTMVFDNNPVMIAAGAIMGVRVAFWMLVGSVGLIFILGPASYFDLWMNPQGLGAFAPNGQFAWVWGEWLRLEGAPVFAVTMPAKAWKESGLWFGVPIMVTSGLLAFALQWRTIVRAFSRSSGGDDADPRVAETEVPGSWFLYGTVFFAVLVAIVGEIWFHIPWYFGLLAVAMTFFLSLVAARATGETDITPIGAMGKITQLTYGVLIPQSTTANLMTASITANCATSAADLLTDLKSGYLLGAHPRRQFMAQFLGIFAGTIAMVGGFFLLVPDASTLNGVGEAAPAYPAPAAQSWKAVAELFKYGFENMHPAHRMLLLWGSLIGVVLVLAENYLPKYKKFLPSATGLGLGLILPFQYPFAMMIGALIGWAWTKKNEKQAETYLVPVSAGLIAGISIMGVIAAILNNTLFAG